MSIAGRAFVIGLVLVAGCGGTKWSSTVASPTTARPRTRVTVVTTPPGWTRYRDASGLTLRHPPTWTTQASHFGPVFIFVDPGPDAGGFRRNINVFSEPLPGGMTASDYLRISVSQVETEGGRIATNSDATLDGPRAHQLIWHVTKSGKPLAFLSIWTIRGRTAYIVTYSADDANFDAPLADVRRLIASIHLPPA